MEDERLKKMLLSLFDMTHDIKSIAEVVRDKKFLDGDTAMVLDRFIVRSDCRLSEFKDAYGPMDFAVNGVDAPMGTVPTSLH